MTEAVPTLRGAEVERSLAWWARLGFGEELRHQFEDGLPLFVGLRRDECRVYLSEHR